MEDMFSLREKREKILFYDYLGMPPEEIAQYLNLSLRTIQTTLREPVLKHRTVFFVGYMDTSPEIINKITNTVQDQKNHG
tara:strand:- start:34676 stop:34915 length:240 start_codon:yes stop_codon:yes gene_type:complete